MLILDHELKGLAMAYGIGFVEQMLVRRPGIFKQPEHDLPNLPLGEEVRPEERFQAQAIEQTHKDPMTSLRASVVVRTRHPDVEAGREEGRLYLRRFLCPFREDKEDLLFAVYQRQLTEIVNSLRARIDSNASVSERVSAMRDYYIDLIEDTNLLLFFVEFRLYVIRNG